MAVVTTNTVKSIKKEAFVAGDEIAAAVCSFVNAPEGTVVTPEVRVIEGVEVEGYALTWDHTPKSRAPRKPKTAG